ncbi:alginate lyase family protein [Luteolibacter arcticus]|uniref:Alginate lyase family protein n=1 Tax=Luteolibacter arcticus TaxID=1581411 RepID=A0ABT3GQN7_9BACT|nr:alginate lyase family protein [Luteolibacter arcticus]MCW1925794.1 alginate lyase family protein [Luteolibacter arcticus]
MKLLRSLFLLPLLSALLLGAAAARDFIHPGGLHTQADFDRMKAKVAAKEHPWIDGWEALIRDRKSASDYRAAPHPHMGSRQRAQDDATAAYLNALRWVISGEKAHAECAVRILNGWASTVKEVPRGTDQPGLSGIPIGSFALAAEVLRTYPGWSAADQEKFKRLLLEYFYPVCHDFLVRHNGASDSNYWANWDTCNMRAVLAIGVFCDDRAKFDEAVDYFKNGRGMGSLKNAVPFLYPGGLGQWQESGRDQAHAMGGMGLLVEMCQVAWNQGLDLFGHDDNRLLAGGEYTAQYTLWKGVPYTYYTNSSRANQYYISRNYQGRLAASHFELLYNHYVVRQKLKAPHVQLFAEFRRPEPGEVDVFGYGTLTYTLDAAASPLATSPPPVPRELRAEPGIDRIDLKWSPSGAYSAHGYEVSRATSRNGPYTSIYSTNNWTTPAYTDTAVEAGKTYHYTIAALNNAGKSESSAPVSAEPAKGGPLPSAFKSVSTEGITFSEAAGRSFVVPGTGRDIDGSFAGLPVEGDFDLTARLIGWRGPVGLMGIVVREEGNKSPLAAAMTLGEIGGRQARFRARDDKGKTATKAGNDYTWLPVWFRIQRDGDDFTAWQSPDGIEWFEVGKSTVKLPRTALAGLLVSTGGNPPGTKKEDAPQGLFDHVTIERKLPSPPAAPTALKATATNNGNPSSNGVMTLVWKNAPNSGQAGIKVEASLNGSPFYEIADLPADATRFENTGLKDPAALRYRIRAYHRGGYSAYSSVAP